uniref:Uncharacterized protein n=1 Tax=Anguilla anguilla TaxID=7936 RepID=A0A0E9S9J8_ANGAN
MYTVIWFNSGAFLTSQSGTTIPNRKRHYTMPTVIRMHAMATLPLCTVTRCK